jgi:hypothetical protein
MAPGAGHRPSMAKDPHEQGVMADLPLWIQIAFKVLIAASVVVTASVVAERSGPFAGGLILALPVSIGPAYALLALQASPQFISESGLGSLASNVMVGAYVVTYLALALRVPLAVSLGGAVVVWLGGVLVLKTMALSALPLLILNVLSFALFIPLSRQALTVAPPPPRVRHWFALPLRAVLVGMLVGTTLTVSALIGPAWTGIAMAFPITLTSSILIMQPAIGAAATRALMATVIRGLAPFTLAYWLIYACAVPLGTWPALGLALLSILVWVGLLYWRGPGLR